VPRYPQAPYIGPPNGYGNYPTTKTGIAIHATANNGSDTDEANYATHRTDQTSSHFYVDVDSVTQSLDTNLVAWHAGSNEGNERAISIEITGQLGWTYNQWMQRVDWPELVALIAWLCDVHAIRAERPSIAGMRNGMGGIYTHNDMRLAWGGTDHTDPGPNFPMDHLLTQVAIALGQHPTTPTEDDMPQFTTHQLKAGYGVPNATILTIPPSKGGANWGQGWLSFGADFGTATLRIGVWSPKGWTIVESLTVSNATGRIPWKGDGKLPDGAGVVSIVRVSDTPSDVPVAALIEYGAR
jgi:N-acetyl-anhydromuramyl-L-alanine amidase AmpD